MDIQLEFERECYKCYGASRWHGDVQPCAECGNTGRVGTSLGYELIEFLENQKKRDEAKQVIEQGGGV